MDDKKIIVWATDKEVFEADDECTKKYFKTLKALQDDTPYKKGFLYGNWEFVTAPQDTTKERTTNMINRKSTNDILENNMKRYK